ncbi:MAG: T9SS type A sorting domain-containing protein [Flavobacteriales bacterium]|nr:T9SS type A sorting domain-containing protein [Flavobacteriales bacterium]
METTGTAPNRVCVIQYAQFHATYADAGQVMDMQIRLYETTNVVEFVYNNASAITTYTGQVGLRGGTTDFNNRLTTTDWTATTAGVVASTVTWSSTVFPPNGLTYTWTPPAVLDAAAVSVFQTTPACPGATESLTARVENRGGTTIDLSTNPISVSVNVTGAAIATLTGTASSGTIPSCGSYDIVLTPTLDMSAVGTYTFASTLTMTGDAVAGNNTSSNGITNAALYTVPQVANFAAFTGANLAAVHTGYSEGIGAALPAGTASAWAQSAAAQESGFATRTTKVNLLAASKREWIVAPKVVVGAADVISFKAAITDVGTVTPDASGGMLASDDDVQVMISNNCGVSYTSLLTINAANLQGVTNSLTQILVPLTSYVGQTVIVAIRASEGTVDDVASYDFHLDDFGVVTPPAIDMGATALFAPGAAGCYSATQAVTVTIQNLSPTAIDFSVDPVTVSVTGTGGYSDNVVLNVGTLAGLASQNVTMASTIDMSVGGLYTFNASTSVAGDGTPGNDAMAAANRTTVPPVATPVNEDFNTVQALPAGWSQSTSTWSFAVGDHGVGGTGGMYGNIYSAATSKSFNIVKTGPIGATDEFKFDYRIMIWSGYPGAGPATLFSPIYVEVSTDCGGSFSQLDLIDGGNHVVSANWATKTYSLASYAGSELIVRVNIPWTQSDLYYDFDNFVIATPPSCITPTGLMQTALTATSLGASWNAEASADLGYEWEIRTDQNPGTPGPALVETNTTMGTTLASTVALFPDVTYYVYVRSVCTGALPTSGWTSALVVYTGYCTTSVTNQDDEIWRVEFANIDNLPTPGGTGWGLGGYQDFSNLVASVETDVAIPFTITKSVFYTGDQLGIWIDLNNDLDFDDAGEQLFNGPHTANPLSGSITIPGSTPPGNHRMRIRAVYTGDLPACGNTAYGEVEDYTISICSPPTDNGTVLANDDCLGDFGVSVTADLGSGSSATIEYTINGVGQSPEVYADGFLLGPFPTHVVVGVSVVTDQGCSVDVGTFTSACDIELDCNDPPIQMVHCYDNADTKTWTWVNNDVGGTVAVKFLSGTMDAADQVLFWEGAVGGTPHATYPSLTGTLTNITVTSVGQTLSMSINSNGSNSCADAGQAAGWAFQARCGGCSEPVGDILTSVNFLPLPDEVDCNASPDPTFNAYATIFDNGIDENTSAAPATVGYRLFVNNVAQPDVTGLLGGFDAFFPPDGTTNPYFLGTYPLGTDLDLILLHEDQVGQSSCNNQVATNFTVGHEWCPPANDDCAFAEVLTLNPDGACPANAITGTTVGAGQEGILPECQTRGVAQDVWYTFNSGNSNSFTMSLTTGTADNIGVQLFTACGVPSLGACLYDFVGPGDIIVTVAAGTDYWLRVFTDVSAGPAGTFNVCVSAFDPCLDILPISDCAVPVQATRTAGIGAWDNLGGPWGTPARERIFTFTPSATGSHNLEVSAITTVSGVDFYYKESSLGCNSVGWTYVDDVFAPQSGPGLALTAGIEYYIMWDGEGTFDNNDVTFSLACPLPLPANDEVCGAVPLTVNTSCVYTGSTTAGATGTVSVPPAACASYAGGDVWFSVTVPAGGEVTFATQAGVITDSGMEVFGSDDNTCTGVLTSLQCNDDAVGLMSVISLTGQTPGSVLFVRVWEYGGDNPGTFGICASEPPPAPANDDCGGAFALTVNPDDACGSVTAGTVQSATASPEDAVACGGTEDDDVWFSFVATGTTHQIDLINVAGSTTDLYHSLWEGGCGSLTLVPGTCSDPESSTPSGLTIGATYFVRVYTWTGTSGQTSTFDVCVGTPPPPPANDDCAGAVALTVNPDFACGVVTAGSNVSSSASVQPDDVSGTPNTDVWYSFVATNTAHRISLINIVAQGGAFNSTDMGIGVYEGLPSPCEAAGMLLVGSSDPETFNVAGLTPATTYYVRVYGWSSSLTYQDFDICVGTPPPPPGNDNCAGAVNLPVSTGIVCTAQTAGTLESATDSGEPVSPCTGVPNNDVWYSFVATSNQHIISLSSIAPTTTMRMQLYSGACGAFVSEGCAIVNGWTTPATLIPAATYFVRVYSSTATAVATTFNICVTTPPVGPPANDNCAGAINVPVNSGQTCSSQTFGTVFGATASGQAVSPCAGTADDDVWFSFVASGPTHTVSLNSVAGSVTSMNFNVFSGTCAGVLTNIGCGATGTAPTTAIGGLTAGNTYFVRVYTNTATAGQNTTFNVCITSPPANDLCANAIAISCNSVTAGSTVGATTTGAFAGTCGTNLNTAGGVWYTVQGWGGPISVSLCGATWDTKIGVFTGPCGAMTCVLGNDDFCGLQSGLTFSSTLGTTYYIYVTGFSTNSGAFNLSVQCGTNTMACAANGLTLEFQTDANPAQTTWQLWNEADDLLVLSGGPLNPANSVETNFGCVPDGCYRLRVLDSGGDGMTTGGYILRTTGSNLRIIDNKNNFNGVYDGNVSTLGSGAFCFPMDVVNQPIYSSCDKLDWVTNKFIVATEDPAVTAAYATPALRTSSGYLFWFFDPNGSYSFRRFRKHSESDGYGTGALRANHFRINSWANTPSSPHLPDGVLLNVRIMGRVNWSWTTWGPACQFKMDAALAACPRVNLQDNPNLNEYSCGVNRVFGGSNHWTNRVTASQPQPVPGVSSSLVRYQFRFRIPGEAICIIRPPQTSPRLFMNWSADSGEQLECGKQYEVDVRVSLDGGANWCFDVASPACVEPVTTWGNVCMVNITTSTYCPGPLQGGSSSMATQNGDLTMYPNPNRGDQLYINLSAVDADVNTVSVDIYDLTGKRISARTIAVQDGFLNTVLDLNGEIASGLYMVNITAGDKTYTERLVIQK